MSPLAEHPDAFPPADDDDLILESWMEFHEIDAEPSEEETDSV